MLHTCVSRRHAFSDLAEAQRCCVARERLGDKKELLDQERAAEEAANALNHQWAGVREQIASYERLKTELEENLAQAKAKRHEMLAGAQIPKPDSALASLPSDIEHVKGQIQQKQDELSSIQGKQRSAAERLSETRRELAKIEFHAKRDSLYKEMIGLVMRWNECAAKLQELRKEAADTTSTVYDGEFAVLPPDLVRFAGNARPALKVIGLKTDVPLFMDGARSGMFL